MNIPHGFSKIALIAFSSISSWSQTAGDVTQPLVGQHLILLHAGDQSKIKLKKSQLSRVRGGCDVAVLVKDAESKTGTVRFKLQYIGTPSVMDQPQVSCASLHDEIVLELSGFAPDEPAHLLLDSVRQVLQTPEEYLAYKGIRLSIPPRPEDEIPVYPPSPITYPRVLLRVNGAYTSDLWDFFKDVPHGTIHAV